MDIVGQIIAVVVMLFFLIGVPLLGIFCLVRRSEATIRSRDKLLRSLLGEDIKIFRSFPIPQDIEAIIQGGLHQTIQRFREIIVNDSWIFIQPTYRNIPTITLSEERNAAILSLYATKLQHYSPTFIIRNQQNNSLLSRYHQRQVHNKQFIPSELNFDDKQNLYAERGKHLQALQIMSPELLDVLKDAPGKADLIIRKNILYYVLPGEQSAEKILPMIIEHSKIATLELEDNLERWAKSASNTEELDEIKKLDLAVTLREAWEAGKLSIKK